MGRRSETILKINTPKTNTEEKQRKRTIRWGIKSCLSILLAATVTTTTIYSQVLYAQAEAGETSDGKKSFTFQPLAETKYTFEEKGTLDATREEFRKLGLNTLIVKAETGSVVTEPVNLPGEGTIDVSGNTTGSDVTDTDSTENTTGSDVTDADSPDNTDGSDTKDPENTQGSGAEGTDSPDNIDSSDVQDPENTSGSDTEGTDTSESTDGSNDESSGNTVNSDDTNAVDTDSSENSTTVLSVTVPDTPVNSAPEEAPVEIMMAENKAGSDVSDNDSEGNTNPGTSDDPSVSQKTYELPVEWSCDHYDEIRPYYIFKPEWNEDEFDYKGTEDEIPVITVTFDSIPGISRSVHDQGELQDAFLNLPIDGSEYRIVLENDIALTETLNVVLPAGANVTLQSNGGENGAVYSLTRGSTVSPDSGTPPMPFTGAMLNFGTSEAAQAAGDVAMPFAAGQNAGGTLTLRDITIDGKITADISDPSSDVNQVHAPAVISSGHLILEKGASIINNYNIGTYLLDENGLVLYTVLPYGGGIRVCGGTLELQKGCHVQFNKAGLRGGGIYLDPGAVLYCYTEADAIVGNTVLEEGEGTGADLYACQGSKIYYDPAVFIPWSSFYIVDPAGTLIPINAPTLDKTTPIEIYLHVGAGSGYSYREVKEKLESTFGDRVTVLMPQTHIIDTTDLRNWYVYDHYDGNCWDAADKNGNKKPDSWEEAYKEYLHRPYYGYTPRFTTDSVEGNSISSWLKNPPIFPTVAFGDCLALVPFKEHIYSRTENGKPEMTFVGYDKTANVDFLFYDPQSAGQKTIEFDVNSSKVNAHTLAGSGFLLNTGITDGNMLSGYLLYYLYPEPSNTSGTIVSTPSTISLYRFSDIYIDSLHDGSSKSAIINNSNLVGSKSFNIETEDWETEMSIKITVDGNNVTVTQHPKDNTDASKTFTWKIEDGNFNGFGPLVAYKTHACQAASSFTYSNLRMQFTDPDQEKNLLSSLTEADFSQQGGVKRYFLNLLGESKTLAYTDESGTEFGDQYHEFLYMMQDEGIGLITDAKTPFAKYLGPTNISPNLFEVPNPDKKADINTLIANLQTYLSMYHTTELPADLRGLEPAAARKPLGNIWLADASNGVQLPRVLNANALPTYYMVSVMDIACDPSGGGYTAEYFLRKPGSSEYKKLDPLDGTSENAVAYSSRSGGKGARFTITTNDPVEWPEGQYAIKQTVRQNGDTDDSAICGYSYFTLTRSSITEDSPTGTPTVSTSSSGSSHGSAPVLAAPEITVPDVVRPTVTSDGASQPKTGDGMFPAIPVACGACTAFMMKIMLWMYDVDFDIVTEHKEEVVRSLILWGKGSARPRIYIAIVALTAVITAYHLLKAFVANSKQIVRERLGI